MVYKQELDEVTGEDKEFGDLTEVIGEATERKRRSYRFLVLQL